MLRRALVLPLLALSTAAFGIPAIACGLVGARAAVRRITTTWARLILFGVGVEVVVDGIGHVPHGPAVYAANHGSALDIPLLFGHLPVDFRILHKRALYLVPVIGLYLYAAGHIGIDRGNAFRAKRSLRRAAARIRGGTSVAVFPEGTRSTCGAVAMFKRGSFLLALEAGVPVVPISLVGVKEVMPHGLRGMRPGRVRMIVHPALETAGRSQQDAAALADEVRRIVISGCEAA